MGVVDQMAEFTVDVKGDHGDLLAEVRGQFSLMLMLIYYLEIRLLPAYCY